MKERSKQNYKDYYELKETIGRGAFGTVYKGIEKETNELRAIKVIDLKKFKENLLYEYKNGKIKEQLHLYIEQCFEEFTNMRICAKNNINSVKCYEYFHNEDTFVIIMELCDTNLSNLLYKRMQKTYEMFNSEEIYEIMMQLNNTFKIMKENCIIHRNLKLEDILIKYKDEEHKKYIIKLSDFCCSKKLISLSDTCNEVVGTFEYMAPEVLEGENYSYKCDLWSIGIILYKLIFGKSPYSGISTQHIIRQIESFGNKTFKKTGDKELDDLILKLLEKDSLKRINWDEYFDHPFFKKYKDEINLIYYTEKDGIENIFGKKFVENNKNNIELIINGIKNKLVSEYELKKGENNIRIIIKNKIINLEEMFICCKALKKIEELKYLDIKEINNFSHMFWGCSSLSDIKSLENWNVSKGKNFSYMFCGCSLLKDIKSLENWNVAKGNDFSYMFCGCSSLKDIKSLNNWNVSNGNNFSHMFWGCSSLSDIKSLENWNVSNGNNFSSFFYNCSSLSDLKSLENWNVSNGNNFSYMFNGCPLLSEIKSLENWNVSNGNNFSYMFNGCSLLSDIKSLNNWNVSNGNNFSYMFNGCSALSEIKSLKNWNVSNGNDFSYMFNGCSALSDIKSLENWDVSKGNNFSYMFNGCSALSEIKSLEKWNVSKGNNFSYMFDGCSASSNIKSLEKKWNKKLSDINQLEKKFLKLNINENKIVFNEIKDNSQITLEEMNYLKLYIKNILNSRYYKNLSDFEKKKKFIENSIKYSRLLKKYISIENIINPKNYIDIDNILKNYNNLNKKFNSTDNPIFILSLLSKCFEKLGIKIFITTEKSKKLNNIGISSIQSLISLLGQKKYEIHFNFGKIENDKILKNEKEKEKFLFEYKEKLSKAFKIESQKIIFTDVHHGCVGAYCSIIDPANENPLQLNDKDKENLCITKIEVKNILEYLEISSEILEPIGDREIGFWGIGEIRGGNVYMPPLNGWMGVGLKVWNQYDNGNNDWIDFENVEGEFSIAYLGINNELNDIGKVIMEKLYKEDKDIRSSNNGHNIKCGQGICLFQNPDDAENSAGYIDILGFRIKILLMCRVNPKKIRQPANYNYLWILNPTPDEVRPYRILIKKIPVSPLALANQNDILTTNSPISYIVDSILSNDTSFYNLSTTNSKEYNNIKASGITNEKLAIRLYSSEDNKYINNYLRTKKLKVWDDEDEVYNENELRSWIYCLHSALKHFRNNVEKDVVYRGVNRKLPENITIGSKFYLREFCSTSGERDVAELYAGGGSLFIIKIKNNGINQHENYCLNITEFSEYSHEEEVLISCHCYFSVTDIRRGIYNRECGIYYDEIYLDCEGYKFNQKNN